MNQIYEPQRRLSVAFPDGEIIDCQHATETFEKTIRKLGVEKCEPYDNLIRHHKVGLPPSARKEVRIGDYCVDCGGPTVDRVLRLRHVAFKLGIPLKIDDPLK